jgi:hypothetical protein
MYITVVCSYGTRRFVDSLGKLKAEYSVSEIVDLTTGQHGNEKFKLFFKSTKINRKGK